MPKRVVGQQSGRSMRSMFGRSALAVLGTLVVLIIGAAAVGEWLGWPFLRAPIEREIAQRIQRDVSFADDFRLGVIGAVTLRSDRFVIGPPRGDALPARAPDEFVRANDVALVLPYRTILGALAGSDRPLRVSSFSVAQLDAVLWRDADGRANWTFGEAASREDDADTPIVLPEFDRLVVREGRLRIDDEIAGLHAVVDVSSDEGRSAAGGGSAAGGEGLRVSAQGTWQERPLRVRLRSSGLLPIAQSTERSPAVPVHLQVRAREVRFEFDGQLADVLTLQSLDGRFELKAPTLAAVGEAAGLTLPNTPPLVANGRLRRDGVVWFADVASFATGKSNLSGEFRYDPQPAVPMLSGVLRGSRLALGDLAAAAGSEPQGSAAGRSKSDRAGKPGAVHADAPVRNPDGSGRAKAPAAPADAVLPRREFDIPSLRAMNASVEAELEELDLPTRAIGSMAPIRAKVQLNDGVLDVGELVARIAGGTVRGDIRLDSRANDPAWMADIGWSGVDLAKWILLRNDAAKPGQREFVTGVLSGRAKVRGVGRSTAGILGSLDGSLAAWMRDGSISHLIVEATGLDIAQGVGLLVVGDEPLPLHCAITRWRAEDGVLHAEVGILDTPDSTVFVSGKVSLEEERLALVLTARPKDFSPLTVRAPVHVAGSFAEPSISADRKTIGAKLAAAAVLAAINPLAALIPLMDPADPATRQCIDVVQAGRNGAARKASPKSAPQVAPKAPAKPEAAPRSEPLQ